MLGRGFPDRPAAGAHGSVPRDPHLERAERGRHQAREAHLIERTRPGELRPAPDDRVDEGTADRQRWRLHVLREVEARDKDAHLARRLVQRVEAPRLELERRLS